jgi:hypothetical protein
MSSSRAKLDLLSMYDARIAKLSKGMMVPEKRIWHMSTSAPDF